VDENRHAPYPYSVILWMVYGQNHLLIQRISKYDKVDK